MASKPTKKASKPAPDADQKIKDLQKATGNYFDTLLAKLNSIKR